MSSLDISGVSKRYGKVDILRDVSLRVSEGAIVALLGSSGSGKTTLLRLIAGFEQPDTGKIRIGDRVVANDQTRIPPEARRIGYVPQEGALFPHMTVAENVSFGLARADRRNGRLAEMLRLTGMTAFAARYPHQLSGGQQQRTALARALAPNPGVVLLDEPFNALDIDLRRSVCGHVIATLRKAGATAILVTHDPIEAFASADIVAVMRHGTISQIGEPHEVYGHPIDANVARMTGASIFLRGQVEGDVANTELGRIRLHANALPARSVAEIMVRPEQIRIGREGGVHGRIAAAVFCGDHTLVKVAHRERVFEIPVAGPCEFQIGEMVSLQVDHVCVAFPPHPAMA
ncbi:ABC transporter ATP-binding protein [Terrarubrum flagellatum]|uniref:ABC transporter ATP-binding protein n=1 Tax=Terrirubrum flagellatum TaxID=2895980 RepID=UPI003145257B